MCLVCSPVAFVLKYFKADIKKIIEFNDIHKHTNKDDTCSKKIKLVLESLVLDKFHFL